MTNRLFLDKQRAEIYVRDRATCSFSGTNLWVLDSGFINWDWDWVDHVKPFSKKGKTEVSNGILLSSRYNYMLSDSKKKYYQFFDGYPTFYYFCINNVIDNKLKKRIKKFSKLNISDWYFKRAASYILFALDYLVHGKRVDGSEKKRTDIYYIKAAFEKLKDWEKIKKIEGAKSFEARNLIAKKPDFDQLNLLKLRDCQSIENIKKIVHDLLPYYKSYVKYENFFYDYYEYLLELTYDDIEVIKKKKIAHEFLNKKRPKIDQKTLLPRYIPIINNNIKSIEEILFS